MADSRKGIAVSTFSRRGSVGSTTLVRRDGSVDTTGPVISNIHANEINRANIILDWDTDEPANCQVSISTNADMSDATDYAVHEHYVTTGRSYNCSGLTPGTQYYFQITSEDRAGNSTTTVTYTMTTASAGDGGSIPAVA